MTLSYIQIHFCSLIPIHPGLMVQHCQVSLLCNEMDTLSTAQPQWATLMNRSKVLHHLLPCDFP